MFFRPRRGLLEAFFAALLVGVLAPRVQAQQAAPSNAPIDLQLFRPAMDSKGFITLNSSHTLAPGDLSFGLVTTWGARVLDLNMGEQIGGQDRRFAVNHLVTPSLQAAVGLFKMPYVGLELGLVLPMSIISGRGYPSDPGTDAGAADNQDWAFAKQGLGDMMIHPKLRILNASRTGIGIAIIPSIVIGTGDQKTFLGEGQTIFQPSAVVDTEWGYLGRFRAAVNVGMRMRKEATFVDDVDHFSVQREYQGTPIHTGMGLRVGQELLFGAAVSYGIVPQKFDVLAEVYGSSGSNSVRIASDGSETKMPASVEAIGGIKLYLARNSFFTVGGGWRVSSGYGAAAPRAFIGFIFEPSIGDRDGDGYKDDVDQCPDDPEDFDDFEDEDGCPEPDNDKDGILDIDDKCPNDPETRNGFEDEDGCPDSTSHDRDGDGIPDDSDKCPDDPEDRDNFEDDDGCPDPDNDRDGILDVNDLCPNDPEDKDGFEDQDGCPDPDNDKDRILDASDRCPNDPEVYNGVDDDDGCPDKGKVIVRKGKLEILDKIYFETDKDVIRPESFPLIDAIAATIKGNPQLQLIEIQGHADERGNDEHNLDLTERRAASVRRALFERGVNPGILRSRGYGETKPVCTQHNEDCWSKNRRTEFIILKRADEHELSGSGEGQ